MNNDIPMTSSKPYIIRALHEWISDNDCTPYLYINTTVGGLALPEHLYGENPLILSASYNACKDLQLDNESITFQARFNGAVHDVFLPIDSVIAIISRETGDGMTFDTPTSDESQNMQESEENTEKSGEKNEQSPKKKKGLKIIR